MTDISDYNIKYPVMEHFYTIQGEGFHQGRAAYFVRLGGCDVGCVWCDVKDSWNADAHPKMSIEEIIKNIKQQTDSGLVVITGGEPLMHNLTALTKAIQDAGYQTNIETSGAHQLTGTWNWICLSPKKFKIPQEEILPFVNELKVVIFNKTDFEWAENYATKVNTLCKLYLQPEWDKASAITPLIIEYVKRNPKWEISLQIHKYINIP
jgi:organic radical activating enzyme